MNLSPEQLQALEHGSCVPVVVQGREYVMLSREVYERVKRVLEYDDSESPRETYPAVLKAWDAYGSPDDATLYQDVQSE
jgi:hypothetical protein